MGSLSNTTGPGQANVAALMQIKKPVPLARSLQDFLTDAYNAEKSNLEPATPAINGFTLRDREAAISIRIIDGDGNDHYAEINGTKMHFSGSLVKVAALYAAFDLRAAARQHAKDNNFSDKSSFLTSLSSAIDTSAAIQRLKDFGIGLKPNLNQIFNGFKASAPNTVEFRPDFQANMDGILENENAGRIIRALGYSFINVSMIVGKFFDPDSAKLNGIWLAGDYSGEGILKSVRVPVENDTVPNGSGQAITTREMSRMFYVAHSGSGFSNVVDPFERTNANQGMHSILASQGSFFQNTTTTVHISVVPRFTKHCAKVGIGRLGPIGAPGPSVISEGAVMKWTNSEADSFNEKFGRNLTGDFAVCWQNIYRPNSHFDALVRILNTSILNFLTQ